MTPQDDSALFDPDLELAISSVIDSSDFWRWVLSLRVVVLFDCKLTAVRSNPAGINRCLPTHLPESCRRGIVNSEVLSMQ